MGAFHCPLGATQRGSKACIECGLCEASTKEEQIAAANIMREFIRNTANNEPASIRKIAVCGKGGVGKSTTASLAARAMAELGYHVVVIDTDESNPMLKRNLGMEQEPTPLITMLERFGLDEKASDTGWLTKQNFSFSEIPPIYLSSNGNISLMCAGKIEDPLSGCACAMNDIAREIMQNMETKPGEIILADMEAGVESFGRGMERGVDTILIIVEPSMDSIMLAEKIRYMAEGLGIRRIRAIINKAPDEKTVKQIAKMLLERGVKYLGGVLLNGDIAAASLEGKQPPKTESYETILKLVKLMFDEADMRYPVNP